MIYSPSSAPLERFLFDVSAFPTVPLSEALTPFEEQTEGSGPAPSKAPSGSTRVAVVDLEEQFRAIFARLASSCSHLAPLPENCSFTVCIELKDDVGVDPPVGHPQPWIPAQPTLQPAGNQDGIEQGGSTGGRKGRDLGGVKTTPIRSVEAGEFVMEMWIEEGKAKSDLQNSGSSAEST